MSVNGGFFDANVTVTGEYDRNYNSEDFAKCFKGFCSSGIVGKNKELSDDFKLIRKTGEPSNIFVVNPGYAWIDGRWVESTAAIEFEVDMPEEVGKQRIDGFFIRCDFETREFSIIKRKGEPFQREEGEVHHLPPQSQNDKNAVEILIGYVLVSEFSFDNNSVTIYDKRKFAEYKVNDSALAGLSFVLCTQAEYDDMPEHYTNVIYIII